MKNNNFKPNTSIVANTYPDQYVITQSTLDLLPPTFRDKINIVDINENCINILKAKSLELQQNKHKWKKINYADMRMVELDQLGSDSVNQLIINSDIVNLYNAIK